MSFIDLTDLAIEYVTPSKSQGHGEVVTGEQVELARLRFEKGAGAEAHAHAHEQIILVLEGALEMTLDGETRVMGPGQGFHALPNVPHQVTAVEDCVCINVKGIVSGVGNKTDPPEM